jgi:hypothetical protein
MNNHTLINALCFRDSKDLEKFIDASNSNLSIKKLIINKNVNLQYFEKLFDKLISFNLSQLIVKDIVLTEEITKLIINFLKNVNTLELINFTNIDINYIYSIIETLKNNSNLKHICFRKIYFDNNCTIISDIIDQCNRLKSIDINNCNIDSNNYILIGQSLKNNQNLKRLSLENNDLNDIDIKNVIKGISENYNSQINTLYVQNNNITRLPSECVQCTNLQKFYYYNNPIDYIPLNIDNWIESFQKNQNQNIYQDKQNVHNRKIQKCIVQSFNKIINIGQPKFTSEEIIDVIKNDNILTNECKNLILKYSENLDLHSVLHITFKQALQYVFTRIEINENKNDIKLILNKEMEDSKDLCFTGRISRLINCLTSIDPLVNINIVNMNDLFNHIGIQLINKNIYSIEKHKLDFENELKNNGYEFNNNFKNEINSNYYSEIKSFYEIFSKK